MNPATPTLPPTTAAGAATAVPRADAARSDAGTFAALFDLNLAATPQPHDGGAGGRRAETHDGGPRGPDAAGGLAAEATDPAPGAWLAEQLAARSPSGAPADPAAVAAASAVDATATDDAGRSAAPGRAGARAPAAAWPHAGGADDAAARRVLGGSAHDAGAAPATAATTPRRAGDALQAADPGAGAFAAALAERGVRAEAAALAASSAAPGDAIVPTTAAGSTPAPPAFGDAAALAAAATTPATEAGPTAGGSVPEARLPQPPHSPAFAAALGQQVGLWIRHGVQQAVLQLNPADLGPVAVHIALDGQRAHVDFSAAQAATRTALEASLPALAAALRDSGLMLAGGGVFDRPRDRGGDADAPPRPGGDAVERGTDALPAVALRRRGVVDLVA